MNNTLELSSGSVKLAEKVLPSNTSTDLKSIQNKESNLSTAETNGDHPDTIFKNEDNPANLNDNLSNSNSNTKGIESILKNSSQEIKFEKDFNEKSDNFLNKKIKVENNTNGINNTPPEDEINSNEKSSKLTDIPLNNDIKNEGSGTIIDSENNDQESEIKVDPSLSLEELMESGILSTEATNFINVFVKGEYAKNRSLPPLEIYEDLVKLVLTDDSHYDIVMNSMPSSVIIYYPLKRKRKNAKSPLKSLPELLNSADDSGEWSLQEVVCHRFPREIWCIACVTKQKDQCRFKGVRMITLDSENTAKASFRWQEYSDLENDRIMLPKNIRKVARGSKFDVKIREMLDVYIGIDKKLPAINIESKPGIGVSLKSQYLNYILKQCSTSLKGLIDLQLDLFNFKTVHFKSIPITGQHQCDNCSTTLLNIYFLNKHCGNELCFNCYLMNNKSNIGGKCFDTYEHPMTDFIPVTIFPKDVIQWLKDGCNELIKEEELPVSTVDQKLFVYNGKDIDEEEIDRLYKPYLRGAEEEIGLENYQLLMQQGIPFVIKDVRLDQLNNFGVESLNKFYGNVEIEQLIDSSKLGIKVKLSEFLSDFDKYKDGEEKTAYKKIKDWPSFSDFKTVFPKFYNAFLNALPFKQCTQPDGSLNLASYLPQVLNPPDLGPKMYIATGRKDTQYGTTPLHLDAADAVNIMTHSYKSGHEFENIKCAALWHLFDYKDIPNIRNYLEKWARTNRKQNDFNDYIHDQKIYLTESMLEELYEKYNVRAYQVYQNPGDAVFIPAGCAHQVLNLSNCIKVATDFISPERTLQCMHIAKEFSKLPRLHPRNGDIVQTENHILYSCSRAISTLLNTEDKLLEYTIQDPKSARIRNKSKPNTERAPKRKPKTKEPEGEGQDEEQKQQSKSKKPKKSPSVSQRSRPRLSRNSKNQENFEEAENGDN